MQSTDKLIVALDLPDAVQAMAMVDTLGDTVSFYKIGMQLYFAEGNAFLHELKARKKRIFLDLKINDIPETVALAVASVAKLGVDYLTLFTGSRQVEAARRVVEQTQSNLRLLNVTVLTSDASDFAAVEARAQLSLDAGAHGLICSGLETADLRQRFGPAPIIVNPGIRPASEAQLAGGQGSAARTEAQFADDHKAGGPRSAVRTEARFADDHKAGGPRSAARTEAQFVDDQVRIVTPARAMQAGATNIVVGRPITRSQDPAAAAAAIARELLAAGKTQ